MSRRCSKLRWLGGITPVLLAAGLALSCRPARAAVPVDAQLTFTDARDNPVGSGGTLTEYVGLRFPDGEVILFAGSADHETPGVRLQLHVQFRGNPTSVDVTADPNTSFFSDPMPPLGWARNELRFDSLSPGLNLKLYGSYTDTQSGLSIIGQASVALRLFPIAVVNAGPPQARLLSELTQFSDQVAAWASIATDVPAESLGQTLADLKTLRLLLLARYTFPIAARVTGLGGELQARGAPKSLLIRLSQTTHDLAQEGELALSPGLSQETPLLKGVGESVPGWVLPPPAMLPDANGVVSGFWFDLGDDGDW